MEFFIGVHDPYPNPYMCGQGPQDITHTYLHNPVLRRLRTHIDELQKCQTLGKGRFVL